MQKKWAGWTQGGRDAAACACVFLWYLLVISCPKVFRSHPELEEGVPSVARGFGDSQFNVDQDHGDAFLQERTGWSAMWNSQEFWFIAVCSSMKMHVKLMRLFIYRGKGWNIVLSHWVGGGKGAQGMGAAWHQSHQSLSGSCPLCYLTGGPHCQPQCLYSPLGSHLTKIPYVLTPQPGQRQEQDQGARGGWADVGWIWVAEWPEQRAPDVGWLLCHHGCLPRVWLYFFQPAQLLWHLLSLQFLAGSVSLEGTLGCGDIPLGSHCARHTVTNEQGGTMVLPLFVGGEGQFCWTKAFFYPDSFMLVARKEILYLKFYFPWKC